MCWGDSSPSTPRAVLLSPRQLAGEHGAGAVHWSSEKGGSREGQAQHSACELDPTTPETNQLDPSEKRKYSYNDNDLHFKGQTHTQAKP